MELILIVKLCKVSTEAAVIVLFQSSALRPSSLLSVAQRS